MSQIINAVNATETAKQNNTTVDIDAVRTKVAYDNNEYRDFLLKILSNWLRNIRFGLHSHMIYGIYLWRGGLWRIPVHVMFSNNFPTVF